MFANNYLLISFLFLIPNFCRKLFFVVILNINIKLTISIDTCSGLNITLRRNVTILHFSRSVRTRDTLVRHLDSLISILSSHFLSSFLLFSNMFSMYVYKALSTETSKLF